MLQSITISDDLFVNNPASCNKDTEPFKYVDPWDSYEEVVAQPKPDATFHEADRTKSTVEQNVLQRIVDWFKTDSKEASNELPHVPTETKSTIPMLQGEAHPLPSTPPQQHSQLREEHCQQDSTNDSSKINLNQSTSPPPSCSTQTTTCGSDGAPTEVGSPKANSLSVN